MCVAEPLTRSHTQRHTAAHTAKELSSARHGGTHPHAAIPRCSVQVLASSGLASKAASTTQSGQLAENAEHVYTITCMLGDPCSDEEPGVVPMLSRNEGCLGVPQVGSRLWRHA